MALPCAAKTTTELSVTVGKGVMAGAYWVAIDQGYFADEGLSVKPMIYPKGYAGVEDFLAGKADLSSGNRVAFSLLPVDPEKDAVIGVLSYDTNNASITARRDRGITNPLSLKGKTIGTTYGTTAHYWVYKWMTHYGLRVSDVKLEFAKKAQLPELIASGKADAIAIGIDQQGKIEKVLGDNAVLFNDSNIDLKQVMLFASRELIRTKRAEVIAHLRALIRAEQYIHEHPFKAAAIIATAKNLPLEDVAKTINCSATFNLSLRQSLVTDMELIDRWAIDYQLVKRVKPRNYLDYMDYSLLEEIDPSRVTIIR